MEGQPDEALTRAEAAIAGDPWSARAQYDRGRALEELRRYDEAAAAFGSAGALYRGQKEPRDEALATWSQGRAFREAGRCAESREAFGQAAALLATFDPRAAGQAREQAALCS
jgi:tetratricopeptide (TPR) repeat protein